MRCRAICLWLSRCLGLGLLLVLRCGEVVETLLDQLIESRLLLRQLNLKVDPGQTKLGSFVALA